jgi:hypothetical protein
MIEINMIRNKDKDKNQMEKIKEIQKIFKKIK